MNIGTKLRRESSDSCGQNVRSQAIWGDMMRNPSLSISVALERRPKMLPLRATLDSINVNVFADNKQLQQIDNSNWQVLFGRRGAGKTTLLATYANYIANHQDKSARASIELNVTDFISVLDNGDLDAASDIEIAQIYFADFLEKICMHLFKVFSEGNERSKFFRLFQASDKKGYIQDLILTLVDSTRTPTPTDIGGKRQAMRKRMSRNAQGHSFDSGVALSGNVSETMGGLAIKASLGGARKNEQTKEQQVEDLVGLTNFKFNYFKTREIMVTILEALQITQLFIVIDEWSELDRSATRNIQPLFAELLKKVFWNNERFVLKIGAVRNQTKLNTKLKSNGPIGLELGADIFELNLDDVYATLDKTKFYEELIFKHLAYCNPDLNDFRAKEEADFYGTRLTRPLETFITYIFKSRREFETLIEGAGGLPRDFVEIFDALARTRDFSVHPTWNMKEVKTSIREHCVRNKQADIPDDRDVYDVFAKLIALIQANNSRIILVGRNSSRKLLTIVGDFYHKRLLHDVPLMSVPVLIRPRYHMYSADLGLLYDANLVHMDDGVEVSETLPFSSTDTPEKLQRYVLG